VLEAFVESASASDFITGNVFGTEEEDTDLLVAFDESAAASEFIMGNLFGMREIVEEWCTIERMLVTLNLKP